MIYSMETRNFSRIPDAMKLERRWVCWDENKNPVNPRTLYGAKSNDPETWGTFTEAEAQIGKACNVGYQAGTVQGVGFMLGGGWTGIDVDGGSEHGKGEIPQAVIDDFTGLGTYAEYSKSGAGFHFIGLFDGEKLMHTTPPADEVKRNNYGVEMYQGGRYFAITGNIYGIPQPVTDITGTLPALYEKYIGKPWQDKENRERSATKPVESLKPGESGDFLRANIESLLSAIDPDSPRDLWIRVGMALKAEGFDISVFDEWSARGSKYKGYSEIQRTWRSFHRNSGNGVNGGYIVKLAQGNGWRAETLTDSYKPATAERDFSGVVVHTVPETPTEAPETAPQAQANPATGNNAPAQQKAPQATEKPITSASVALGNFLVVTGNTEYKPIRTGLKGVDNMLNGGFDPGTMTIVVAEPGTGKTALIMQIAENMAKNAQPVMVFNLEMSTEQLIARSLSRLTAENAGFHQDNFHNTVDPREFGAVSGKEALYSNAWGLLDEKKREKITSAVETFREYSDNLYLITEPITEHGQIIERVTAFKRQTGKTPVVIVDYLQLLFSDGKTSAVYSAKDIILGLKQRIAREMQTAVIMISATGRDKAKKGKMDLQSAFGSSFIEYSADYQFGLEKVDPDEVAYTGFEKPLSLSLVKGRMDKPHSRQGFFFAGAYSYCREIDIGELRTAEKLVRVKQKEAEKAAKEQEKEDNQGGEHKAPDPAKTSKKPL